MRRSMTLTWPKGASEAQQQIPIVHNFQSLCLIFTKCLVVSKIMFSRHKQPDIYNKFKPKYQKRLINWHSRTVPVKHLGVLFPTKLLRDNKAVYALMLSPGLYTHLWLSVNCITYYKIDIKWLGEWCQGMVSPDRPNLVFMKTYGYNNSQHIRHWDYWHTAPCLIASVNQEKV